MSEDESPPGEEPAEEPSLPPGAAEFIRAAVRAEFDQVIPPLLTALRRNEAFDEVNDRLRRAERRIESRQERPVIVGLHRVLIRLRHLDFDYVVKQALDEDLTRVLSEAGYQETGQVGEDYDPARHDAIDGRAADGKAVVTKVHSHGLVSFGDVVVRAKVEITPGLVPAGAA